MRVPTLRLSVCTIVLCLLPRAASPAAEHQQALGPLPSAELHKFRDQFIKDFHRIGLNTTPGDAQFLRLMVEISAAKRGLEVGTATGYGAIHMGLGFERNGGELITIDIDSKMVATSRENIAQMQLGKVVTVMEGDALEVISTLKGKFDFVFLDAVKKDYLKYFQAIEPMLQYGSVIVADNVIKSAKDMQDFFAALEGNPDYRLTILRASDLKQDGMALIYKLR